MRVWNKIWTLEIENIWIAKYIYPSQLFWWPQLRFQFNRFHDLRNWPQKKRSLRTLPHPYIEIQLTTEGCMMVCLIFHTNIIINRKNWRITIKLFFKKKRTYTNARTPLPSPPVHFCSLFNDPRPSPPQRTYFLNDPKGGLTLSAE